jgi:heme A synthase
MNVLRRPQEAVMTLKNLQQNNAMRKSLGRLVHGPLPLVLLTGFFVAGINGGKSCNTFPWVGNNYFINRNHFNAEIPLW